MTNKELIKKNAPEYADLYAFISGAVVYFYKEGNQVFFMSGKPYLHASITRFYEL